MVSDLVETPGAIPVDFTPLLELPRATTIKTPIPSGPGDPLVL
jgi:hypothetical protein